jgi:high frequency lysogenization protein
VPEQRHLERVMALAGLFQAVALVQKTAREGQLEEQPFSASIYSVLQLDAENTEAIFGGYDGIRLGLDVLRQQLNKRKGGRDVEITRYAVSLLFLEKRLAKRPELLQTIRQGIHSTAGQVRFFSLTHETVIARLADIYTQTVSTLSPRILVTGEPRYLQDPANANRIRALLLAGIRSAVLWRQQGGNRLRLLFARAQILASAETLRAQISG